MARQGLENQIQGCINNFVSELSALVRQAAVESVQEALGATTTPSKSVGRPRRKKATTRGRGAKRVRRSAVDVDAVAESLLALIQSNPGQGASELSEALGMDSKEIRLPMQSLLAEKKVKTTGQRRGTKYHPAGRGGTRKAAPRKKASRKKATRKKTTRKKTTRRKSK